MELGRKPVSHRNGNPRKASSNRKIKQEENMIRWKHNGHEDNLNLTFTAI
jgi:hypothetical protein